MSLLIIVYLCKTLALDTGLYRLQIMTERPARFFIERPEKAPGLYLYGSFLVRIHRPVKRNVPDSLLIPHVEVQAHFPWLR